ncbi:MAG: 30S ribosomal protein S3, partial [Mycoplasmataceae bacterium]|nr:30S ribosomal protein S3 [Mycoplasmataceae bacterium]
MGQKVNPNGFRYGITKKHNTIWYANKKDFPKLLLEDQKIYEYINKFTREYEIGKVEIRRTQNYKVTVFIHTAKPGVVLGQEGSNVKALEKNIQKFVRNKKLDLNIEVVTIDKPSLSAKLLAEDIAIKLENRGSFRNAQKQVIRDAMKAGALGIKTKVSGR